MTAPSPCCAALPRRSRSRRAYDVSTSPRPSPPHAGLGSGTQLALATGARLDGARRLALQPERARRARRPGRTLGHRHGGVRATAASSSTAAAAHADRAPPILVRAHFPEAWRVAARSRRAHGRRARRRRSQGLRRPAAACPMLRQRTSAASSSCSSCRASWRADIDAFGARADRDSGDRRRPFRSCTRRQPLDQPGRWAHRRNSSARWRAIGIGQSSWGPTGFAFAHSKEIAAPPL